MAKVRRVDFSPDEWFAGTRELTLEERGAYWDVCSLMYSRGGPIADDEAWISKALGCHVRTWRTIKARLIAVGKLKIEDGHILNGRAERELKRAEGRLKSSRDAAEESAKLRRERAENATQSNDYKEIPEADASAADGAIYQLATSNSSERKKEVTTTPPVRENGHARAFPIGKEWEPTPETIAELKRQRPDLTGDFYEAELIEFRLWCRANAVSSHDPEATFLKFMRRAKGPNREATESFDQRRIRQARAAVAAVRIP